jgi:hypothetical protein
MRTMWALVALVGSCGGVPDPERPTDTGSTGDQRLYGSPILTLEDTRPSDPFIASEFFPEALESDHCESADSEDEAPGIRIGGLQHFREERGEMPRLRGTSAYVILPGLERSTADADVSTSDRSSAGRPR